MGGGEPFADGAGYSPQRHRDTETDRAIRCSRGGGITVERPPPESFADIGVHTGNCAKKLLRPGGIPIREGKDIVAFELRAPRRTFHPDTPKEEGEYFRASPLARYRGVPIVIRQTADRPIAALHTEPTYFRNSVLACHGIPGGATTEGVRRCDCEAFPRMV